MPSWLEIEEKTSNTYLPYSTEVSPLIYIPIVNIAVTSKVWENTDTRMHAIQ